MRAIVGEIADPKKEMTLTEARKMDPQTEIGGELLIPKPTAVLGRIAAQTAKQVIMQKVREAERDTIFNEYNGRVGELVNCIVKRFEGPDVIVDWGAPKRACPSASNPAWKPIIWATGCASSFAQWTGPPRGRRSSSRAPTRAGAALV